MTRSVAVIGAGAAGLMAAIHAAREQAAVTLFERTREGGLKILVSGGGRCNVLPRALEPDRFVTDSSPRVLGRMLRAWPLEEQLDFFRREAGAPLVLEEPEGKWFPRSGKAREVREALVRLADAAGVQFRRGTRVGGIDPANGGWVVRTETEEASFDAVIVATGGLSLPKTGSDGDGHAWLAALGHQIVPPYPALTPLRSREPAHARLAGLSLEVELRAKGRVARGGFLFTHRGYSGPAVLDLSDVAVRDPRAELRVSWSGERAEVWDERLRAPGARRVRAIAREQLPERLVDRLCEEAGVDGSISVSELPREGRLALVRAFADYELPWRGHEGYAKAEVTGGGVALGEVDPRSLESRRAAGLFLCGEILDAFGPIGGHNFAWAWATGRTAGANAARGPR